MFSRKKEKSESKIDLKQPHIRKFDEKGCMYKIIPSEYHIDLETYNQLRFLDQLHINITNEKEKIIIAKGLHNAQFRQLNNVIIVFSLLISIINLTFAGINDDLSDTVITVGDIIVGILGIMIAYFAKMRDQKEDLVHNMLTTINTCDMFLNTCENKVSKYLKNRAISLDVEEEYGDALERVNEVIAKFNSEEAQAITNGPLKFISCIPLTFRCCVKFDPKYLKKLLIRTNYIKDKNMKDKCETRYCIIDDVPRPPYIENEDEDEVIENNNIEIGISELNVVTI